MKKNLKKAMVLDYAIKGHTELRNEKRKEIKELLEEMGKVFEDK